MALALVVVILASVSVFPWLRNRLISHPDEIPFWGYAASGLLGATWLTFYVGTRLNTRRDDSMVPAQGVVGPRQSYVNRAGTVVGILAAFYGMVVHGGRLGYGGLDERFPSLSDAAGQGALCMSVGCAAIWIAWAVVPPTLAYLRRRAQPGLVDAVVDLGGTNTVRLLYRPTFSLGGKVTWRLDGDRSVTVSPGQAIGFLAPDGPFKATTRKRARDGMVVRLELGAGVGTDIVLRRGLVPRIRLRQRASEVAFVQTQRAFASLWIGPGGIRMPDNADKAMHLWALERPTARPPIDPWWQARWWVPVTSAVGGAAAVWALVAEGQVRDSYGDGDQLVAVVAVPLALRALSLDRARRAVGWQPWRAPLVWLVAGVAGGVMWWGAGWLTAFVALLSGGPIALFTMMVRSRREGASRALTRSIPGAPRSIAVLPHARIAFWKRQADAVVSLKELAPDRATNGYVRVVPVTPSFRGGVGVKIGGWSGTVIDCPVGVRLTAGNYTARVEHRRQVAEVAVEVRPGQVTEVQVGTVPFGLQFGHRRGALSVRVRPSFEAKLIVDQPPVI